VYDAATPRILGVGHGGFQIWSFTGSGQTQRDVKN